MGASLELLRATYEGSSEENGRNLLAALAPDAEWTEAEGFPRWNRELARDPISQQRSWEVFRPVSVFLGG